MENLFPNRAQYHAKIHLLDLSWVDSGRSPMHAVNSFLSLPSHNTVVAQPSVLSYSSQCKASIYTAVLYMYYIAYTTFICSANTTGAGYSFYKALATWDLGTAKRNK